MRKIVYFLLFILILPFANAFLDLRGFYDSNPFLIDFLVFFAIFSIVTMISFKKFFGDTPLQRALSFVVAFALAFAGIYAGYLSLNAIGEIFANSPIVWFLISVLLFVGLFRLVRWIFKKIWLSLLITIIISLCLYYFIFPDNILRMIPFDLDLIGSTVSLLTVLIIIIAVAALIFFGINMLKRASGNLPSEGDESIDGGGRRERPKKSGRLRAFLVEPRGLFGNRRIEVQLGERVRFFGMAKGGSGRYVSYSWNLDGSTSKNAPRSFTHIFRSKGKHSLIFGARDSDGNVGISKVYIIDVRTPVEKQRKNRFDEILEQQRVGRRPRTKEERNQIRQILQQQRVGRRPRVGISKEEAKEIQKQDRQQIKKQKMVRHLDYLAQKKDMDLQKWQMMATKGVDGAKQKVRTLQAELKEISRKIKKYQS